MNVFVLPSWYPNARQPMAGLFARDQALALALARPDWQVTVGLWGHHDGALSVRNPRDSLRALAWRLRTPPQWRQDAAPMYEVLTPRLSWTLTWAGGGVRGLLSASRRNLEQTEAHLGPVQMVHAHVGFPAGWIAAQLAAERDLPYVLTEHMSPFPFPALADAKGKPLPALRQAFDRAAATVAVSSALAERLRSCGLRCDAVIPNAVDETRFPPAHTDPSRRVLFTLGALVPQKGMDVLLHAFAQMPPLSQPVELHIGGDGPERAALLSLAVSLGVAGRVNFLGALRPEQTPAHFAVCDAFVLASHHETFGVVLAEALMSGKPVVATRCGGPEDIVTATNGRLVPPADPAALALALYELLQAPQAFDAAALRADAVARFGLHAVGERLAALCEQVATV